MTRPMGWYRTKAAAEKGKRKGKKSSYSESESYSIVGDMMFTLKKLNALFAKAEL
jgi:hypothetical protein